MIPQLEDCRPGLKAAGYNIIVAMEPVDEKRGALFMPQSVTDKEQMVHTRARILSVGAVAFGYDRFPDGTMPGPGDAVLIGKMAGVVVKGLDDKPYRICTDKDIAAFIEEEADHGQRAAA